MLATSLRHIVDTRDSSPTCTWTPNGCAANGSQTYQHSASRPNVRRRLPTRWMAQHEAALLPHPPAGGDAAVRQPQIQATGCRLQQIQAALQPRASHSAAVSGALAQLQRCAGAEAVVEAYCAASAVPAASACAVSATCATTSALGGCLSGRSEEEDNVVCGASPPRRPSCTGISLPPDAVTLQRRALTSVIRWHPVPRAAAPAVVDADADAPRGTCTHKGEYILVGAAAVLPSAAAGRATAAAEQVPASRKLRSVDDLYSALEAAEVNTLVRVRVRVS